MASISSELRENQEVVYGDVTMKLGKGYDAVIEDKLAKRVRGDNEQLNTT